MIQQDSQNFGIQDDELDIVKEVRYYAFFWPYFLICILLGGIGAYIYLRYQNDIYTSQASVLIENGQSDPTAFLTEGGSDLFGFNKSKIENDIAIMSSNRLLTKVVQRLDLQTKIYSVGRVKSSLMESNQFPFIIEFKPNSEITSLEIIQNGQSFTAKIGEELIEVESNFPSIIRGVSLTPRDSIISNEAAYLINRVSELSAVKSLSGSLKVSTGSRNSDVIDISFNGPNPRLNEAIVNTLIEVLKEDQVADKREISEVSIAFIDERLEGLSESIDTISKNTIAFQSSNAIFDPSVQTGNALSNLIKGQEQALSLGIQKEIATGLLENIKSQNNFDLLPANVGMNNESVNTLVQSYNDAVIQRKSLLVSATEQSPLVINLTAQLEDTRKAIITGITRYIDGLNVSLSRYSELQQQTQSAVASLPAKENTLRGFARNFKIVEELYLFLLQRKEEASISYISALPNVKVLSQAVTQSIPVAPKPRIIYLGAILAGLIVPFGVLFILKTLDTKINTRDDLENGLKGTTIVGEIPLEKDQTKIDSPRGTIAESTRVMRSNLAFMLPDDRPIVITSTSSVKGEGKSFVSFNIARSYAALSKKVILIGSDLRNPQLHNRLGIEREGIGLSTFLSKPNDTNFKDLITLRDNDNVHYLLSGAIPPNPSELLARPAMKTLLDQVKEHYDVIVIDSAPLMLVSDTSPILPLSDLVLYVSRAQVTDKNVFPFIKDLQKRKNMPPLALVLNGIIAGPASYYKYGYAYRYSYNYKYNYGYGYGYGSGDKGDA
ncbi:polysaccharide biosynthesis tyrosine autokinase [Flavobacteriaceae bacterium]|nr:polysaccharide biosynthesis tyrosine autokinase [Flavobacteriaceae bacterium]